MSSHARSRYLPRLGVLVVAALVPAVLVASDRIKGVGKYNPEDETVQLFSAIEAGQLEVRLIPKDSTQCQVLIANRSDRPLNVALPEAFAGVPVLAQFDPFANFGNNNRNNNNSGGQMLGVGNQFGNQGNQFGNQGNRGNQGNNFAPFNMN